MSDHGHGTHAAGHGHDAHHVNYFKVYWWLVGLFLISFVGPFIGEALHMKWLTLVTAFGIAVVKAYLVAANFMHLNIEKKFVAYLLMTALAFMFLFYAGVAPDVMHHRGRNWENVAAQDEVERALAEDLAAPAHH
jgi:caa(3)-type oxidase subunit IV